ncbi:hypothetical protein [Amycolatopsis sp. NPDC051061]|uniref:hypothetical protein n=1 Tax=Amycolatopsis sp. NPDC051061 TaxID=3155042 RepID=UPI003421A6D1
MDHALESDKIRVHFLGLPLDSLTLTLTLTGDLPTIVVIDPDLYYDEMFKNAVDTNDEGTVPAKGLPFEESTIRRLQEIKQLSPGASAAIHLAWKHREMPLQR